MSIFYAQLRLNSKRIPSNMSMRSRTSIRLPLVLATLAGAWMLVFACERAGGPDTLSPVPTVVAAPVPGGLDEPSSPTAPGAAPTPGPTTFAAMAEPSPTPTNPPVVALPTMRPTSRATTPSYTPSVATPVPTHQVSVLAPTPLPTTPVSPDSEPPPEGISRNAWTRDRIAATQAIWSFTAAGREWMDGYDFRQMFGRPAWYGSHGAAGWAGAGEANPRIVLHELGHSWWGAFPVEGRPDLTWDRAGGQISRALSQFHADVEWFLRQPPDSFEPLRDRFRNMPNLSHGDYPDLQHFSEADLVNVTGGNLSLIPPVLRKYFSPFLAQEGVASDQVVDWPSAIGWFRALPEEERRIASEVFGLQHLPNDLYEEVPELPSASLDPHVVSAFQAEERQRLLDFAEQFDLIKQSSSAVYDAANVNRGFSFWRGYLADKKRLHGLYPEVLGDHPSAPARELGEAFDFYLGLDGESPETQVEAVAARLQEPTIREFAVLLNPRAIVELFSDYTGSDVIDRAISERARELAEIARNIEVIVAAARRSPVEGAKILEEYLDSYSDDELRSGLNLAILLIRDTDREVAKNIIPLLSDAAFLRILEVKPDQARAPEVEPQRLLAAVGVTSGASADAIASGARLLQENSSGNFAIDRPYDDAVYDVIESLGASDPAAAIAALKVSEMRLRPWIHRRTDGSLDMMRRELALAAALLAAVPGPRETPDGLLHELIAHDPEVAAALLVEMDNQGEADIAQRTLMALAFDAYWSEWGGVVGVDPELDARFLVELARLRGADWLENHFRDGVERVQLEIEAGETDPQFLEQLRRTLTAALGSSDPLMASRLLAIVRN